MEHVLNVDVPDRKEGGNKDVVLTTAERVEHKDIVQATSLRQTTLVFAPNHSQGLSVPSVPPATIPAVDHGGSSSSPSSAAKKRKSVYCRNTIHSFDLEGRVVIDSLPAMKERRLDTYTLNNLATTLLGKTKVDVTPEVMFAVYRLCIKKCPNSEDIMLMMEHVDEQRNVANETDTLVRELLGKVVYYWTELLQLQTRRGDGGGAAGGAS